MSKRHSGFTLVEMLIVVGLTIVVATELVTVFVGLFQFEKNKMWNSELESKLRMARENLLFRAVPADGSRSYAGILSATNLVWSTPHITAAFQYAKEDGTTGYGENEDVSERFLVQNVDDGERDVPPVYITNNLFFVNTAVTVDGSNRTERIAVSAFGSGGGDNLWLDFMDSNFTLDGESEADVRWLP